MELVCALEHKVLKEMGSARISGSLVSRTYMIGNHRSRDGRTGITRKQNAQSVGFQLVFFDSADTANKSNAWDCRARLFLHPLTILSTIL
jgi:hypothetical protein